MEVITAGTKSFECDVTGCNVVNPDVKPNNWTEVWAKTAVVTKDEDGKDITTYQAWSKPKLRCSLHPIEDWK